MLGANISNLVVLGLTAQGTLRPDNIITIAKVLVPDLWQPTADVVIAAINRNLNAGYLLHTMPDDERGILELTEAGAARLQNLLLCDPGNLNSLGTQAMEALQFCLLDAAEPVIAKRALARLQVLVQRRLAELRQRCTRCPHGGRYANLWMEMEQRRLQAMDQFLAVVRDAAEADGGNALAVAAQ
jgi:hypothetical protein